MLESDVFLSRIAANSGDNSVEQIKEVCSPHRFQVSSGLMQISEVSWEGLMNHVVIVSFPDYPWPINELGTRLRTKDM